MAERIQGETKAGMGVVGWCVLAVVLNLLLTFLLVVLPVVQSLIEISGAVIYIVISVLLLLDGLLTVRIFSFIPSDKRQMIICVGIIWTTLIGVLLTFNIPPRIVLTLIHDQVDSLNNGSPGGIIPMTYLLPVPPADPNIMFALAVLAFNLPVIVFYLRQPRRKVWLLLFYFFPLLVYVGMSFILIFWTKVAILPVSHV